MAYVVLARKWRPRTFDEVVGQSTVTRTLKNAITSDRVGHAFLFSGARGVGKTTTARILAKALNCSAGEGPSAEPCGGCESCVEVAAGSSLDVQEIDGATHNGVEQVRELRESARYNPARDRFKIWIIDEVHMLSTGAFNALLKTLEEPPPRVKFIFATTEYHKIPDTILSRCQQYDFRMIPSRELVAHLRQVADGEGVEVSDAALGQLARAAEGSARDALSLFDQILSFSDRKIEDADLDALLGLIDRELLHAAVAAIDGGKSLAVLELVERLADYGADYRNFTRELLLFFRELLLVKLAPESSPLLAQVTPEERARLAPLAASFSEEDLLRAFDVLTQVETELRQSIDPRVSLELALLKLAQLRKLVPFAELVARVESLAAGESAPPRIRPAPEPSAAPARTRPAPEPPPSPPPQAAPGPAGEPGTAPSPAAAPAATATDGLAAELLRGMLERSGDRPSLAQPLRGATARMEGAALVLEIAGHFAVLAEAHVDEYRELASEVRGRSQEVRVVAAGSAPHSEPAPHSPAEEERESLEREAASEPAVQEVLDLFGGKVVEVRRGS
jgi:DNA polymerase-3 subunit gamma/tau